MTLKTVLQATSTKDLQRVRNTMKEFTYFDVSVFNVGVSVKVRCSNTYKEPNMRTWNGYDLMVENDDTTDFYIAMELSGRSSK